MLKRRKSIDQSRDANSARRRSTMAESKTPTAPFTRYYHQETKEVKKVSRLDGQSTFFNKLFNFTVFFVLIFSIIYSLYLKTIVIRSVSNQAFHTSSEYQTALNKFGGHLKPMLNEDKLGSDMRQLFPEIKSVTIYTPWLGQKATARIVASKPALLFISGNQKYVVDAEGYAISSEADAKKTVINSLVSVEDQTGYEIKIGKQVVSADQVTFIATVVDQLSKKSIAVKKIVLPPIAGEMQLYPEGQSYLVKFFLGGDSKTQTGAYLATLNKLVSGNSPPNEYVDVRAEGRVFVK